MSAGPTSVPAVVLAGGRGRRLEPFTSMFPKPLVPVGERPVLEVILGQLAREGFDDVSISLGYLGELVEAYLRAAADPVLRRARTVREATPLGTAGALSVLDADAIGSAGVLVVNGDVLTDLRFSEVVATHRNQGAAMTIAVQRRSFPVELGVVETSADGRVHGLVEKPIFEADCAIGVNVYGPAAVTIARRGGRVDFDEVVQELLAAGETVAVHRFDGFWADIGREDDHRRAQELASAGCPPWLDGSGS